jgi:hypothetical protein
MSSTNYHFTSDWFSHNIPNIERILEGYKQSPINILEIGSYEGRSSVWFINNYLNEEGSKITCIDPHLLEDPTSPLTNETQKNFLHNISKSKYPEKVTYLQNKTKDVIFTLSDEFDFIYVDGSHLSFDIMFDLVTCWNLLKKDGIMLMDDYGARNEDKIWVSPNHTINNFLLLHEPNSYKVLFKGWQMAIQKLK